MNLKTAQLNPAVFTPSQYAYQAADMSILERSLAQREARMKEATQSKSAIDRTLGEIEMKLNPSETEWFEGYKTDIKNQIQSSIDSGDYGAAIRNATLLAGSTVQDPRILGRIRAQEAYQKELQTQQARRDRREISQNTYDWWVSNNKYSYTDNKDINGNYIEGSPWEASYRPVNDINWVEQATTAFKLITPKKKTTSKGGGYNTVNVDGTSEGNKWNKSDATESITVEDILGNIDELLSSTSDGYRQAEQAYDVAIFDLNRLQKEYDSMSDDNPEKDVIGEKLDARKQLLYKNGSPINYKEYYARMITNNHYANTLSYEWTVNSHENFDSNDYQRSNVPRQGNNNATNNNFNNPNKSNLPTWESANVRWGNTYNYSTIHSSTSNISNRFSN